MKVRIKIEELLDQYNVTLRGLAELAYRRHATLSELRKL